MVTKAEKDLTEDLIRKFREAITGRLTAKERRAMEAVGRQFFFSEGSPEFSIVDGDDTLGDFVCFLLAHMLLHRKITIKPPAVRDRDWDIAWHVFERTENSEKWKSAVKNAAKDAGVSASTGARAWAKHKAYFERYRKSLIYFYTRPGMPFHK